MISIRYVLALALFSMTGVRGGRVLLALYALHLGAQPFTVGVLAAAFSVPPMLLSLVAGRFADRVGARIPLLIGAAGGGLGMLMPYFLPGMPALFVAAVLNGFSFTFMNVTLQNLVGLLSGPDQQARNFSNFSLALAMANFAGPLLVGFSIDHAGYGYACLYLVAVSLVPVAMLFTKKMTLPQVKSKAAPAGSILEALTRPGVWRVLATSSLVVTGIDMFQFYLPIYAHSIALSASVTGVILAAFAAAAFVVRLMMPRLLKRWSVEELLAYSFYLGAATFALVPLFQNGWILMLTSFMFGIGMGCCQPITLMLTFSGSTEGRSGEALGLRLTVNHLTRVVTPLIFGSIGSFFGLFAVVWGNAALLGGGGVITKAHGGRKPPS
jgi:MFS family permease